MLYSWKKKKKAGKTMELWIADIDEIKSISDLQKLTELLPAYEQEKAKKYRFPDDSLRYVTGRLMIRHLAEISGASRDIEICMSEYGKPYFGDESLPMFNLSHSSKKVVLATGNIPLGVDIEENKEINYLELMTVFGHEEQEMITASVSPLETFYQLWTVHEAFAKEEGIGISIIKQKNYRMDYISETIRYQNKLLHYKTIPLPGYSLNLCAEEISNLQTIELKVDSFFKHR